MNNKCIPVIFWLLASMACAGIAAFYAQNHDRTFIVAAVMTVGSFGAFIVAAVEAK